MSRTDVTGTEFGGELARFVNRHKPKEQVVTQDFFYKIINEFPIEVKNMWRNSTEIVLRYGPTRLFLRFPMTIYYIAKYEEGMIAYLPVFEFTNKKGEIQRLSYSEYASLFDAMGYARAYVDIPQPIHQFLANTEVYQTAVNTEIWYFVGELMENLNHYVSSVKKLYELAESTFDIANS